ncbi:hypothetical protein [Streptomyces sp. NPDC015414]|uniref:hypothetical protein n=1 Tax=Streptomyces sp. NPDC015414 TaxID=3364957 RepID=UPI0036FE3D6B
MKGHNHMIVRLYGGLLCMLPQRENTISCCQVPGNVWVGALEIRLQLTIVIVIALMAVPVCGGDDGRLAEVAGLAIRLSLRYLIWRL